MGFPWLFDKAVYAFSIGVHNARAREHFGVARFLDETLRAYRLAVDRKESTAALNSSAQPSDRA